MKLRFALTSPSKLDISLYSLDNIPCQKPFLEIGKVKGLCSVL